MSDIRVSIAPTCDTCHAAPAMLRMRDTGVSLCGDCHGVEDFDMARPFDFYDTDADVAARERDGDAPEDDPDMAYERWLENGRGYVPSLNDEMEEERERAMEWATRSLTPEEKAERARKRQQEINTSVDDLPF